jgi:integrase
LKNVSPSSRRGCPIGYGLRHTTASLAITAGANVKVVERILGHATAAMTLDLYGHLLNDDLDGVAVALGKAIESIAASLRYEAGKASKHKLLEAVI